MCVCMCVCVSCSVVSYSLRPHRLKPTRLLCPWNSPGKNTGVGCHALLQGIFPAQGLNPHLLSLLHWQLGSLPLVPPRKTICERERGERERDRPYLLSFLLPSHLEKKRLDAPLPSLFAGGNFPLKEAEQIWFIAAKVI